LEKSGSDEPEIPEEPETPEENVTFVAKPFSVAIKKRVTFSSGNLQYHPANDKWRFAPSQLDYIGEDNANISDTYNGWIDLFGWGTGNNPTNKSSNYDDYSTFVDWGVNKIGSDAPNTWRSLTKEEWEYIIMGRYNAEELKGVAQVNGVNGLILLPDGWTCPDDVTFKPGFHENDGKEYYAEHQTFSSSDWAKLEASGAVFFPAAGYRNYDGNSNVSGVGSTSCYWNFPPIGYAYEYFLYFYSDGVGVDYDSRCYGFSVRLVKNN
jgi:hypothetical protein